MSNIVPKTTPGQPALQETTSEPLDLAAPGPFGLAAPMPGTGAFFTFQYTFTEFVAHGGRTHVKARRVHLADGRLSTESFEGELGGEAHADAIRQAQARLFEQAAVLLNPWSWLLPAFRRARDEDR